MLTSFVALKIVQCHTSVSKGSLQYIPVELKIFVANLPVKHHLYTDPKLFVQLSIPFREIKKEETCRRYVHNTYYSVCIPGFSSSASSRTDTTHTYRIPRLGEVCSTVHTKLYHSTNAVPATGGRCTQNKSC